MFCYTGMVLALGSIFALGSAMPAVWAHGTTERVSVSSGGAQGDDYSSDPVISADGRFVAFYSFASDLVPGDTNNAADVFVRDRQTGKTRRVSVSSGGAQGNALSFGPAISSDGRFVAFESYASNLVPNDTNNAIDVFVRTLAP
jgi:Tol biopolymer transport system component